MTEWNLVPLGKYLSDYKWYEKKRPNELCAILGNLDTYFEALKMIGNPLQVKSGFIHDEPDGVKAIDQRGGKQKVKLQQTRLYLYPNVSEQKLYLLAIGDKTTQRGDIQFCRERVKEIKQDEKGQ